MRLLLDTNVLLWAVNDTARLDATVRTLLVDPANIVLFSAASIWEIAIKARLGRADFTARPDVILHEARAIGFQEISVQADVASRVATMPLLHGDPFDRLLLAQAIAEQVPFYTADRKLPPYSDLVRLIA